MDLTELKTALEGFSSKFADALKTTTADVTALVKRLDGLEARMNRPGADHSGSDLGIVHGDRKAFNDAFRAFLKGGCQDDRELKSMSIGHDPDGGFLVLPQISTTINRIMRDASPFRRLARMETITVGDAWEEPYDRSEVGAGWVSETQARPATSAPQLAKVRIPLEEMYAMPEATQRLLDDSSYDIAAYISGRIGERLGELGDAAFLSGDGVGKPRGFLTYPTAATADASRAWGTFEHIATGTSGGFGTAPNGSDKLVDVTYALKAGYRANARWMMNSLTAGAVRKLKDAEGRYIWQDSLAAGQPALLCGYPVEFDENMPAIGADSLSIAFGDWRRGYTIVDRPGIRFLSDPLTNKPYVRFYSSARVGGDVVDFNAIKFLKFSVS